MTQPAGATNVGDTNENHTWFPVSIYGYIVLWIIIVAFLAHIFAIRYIYKKISSWLKPENVNIPVLQQMVGAANYIEPSRPEPAYVQHERAYPFDIGHDVGSLPHEEVLELASLRLYSKTVEELKELCRLRHISVTGRKDMLVDRLLHGVPTQYLREVHKTE